MVEKTLWITYAWEDNAGEDFSYLVQQLERAGLKVEYDRVALVPGRRLWDQIAGRIVGGELSGWAYLVTKKSLESEACKEELAYALSRALKQPEFPLIALVHGVSFDDLPTVLRVRLGINLAASDWIEQVRAGIEARPLTKPITSTPDWRMSVHQNHGGQIGLTAFELGPRFGEIRHWRWAYPKAGPAPVTWGHGPSGGGGISQVMTEVLEGEADFASDRFRFVGAGNALTPNTSAYIVFDGLVPQSLAFGIANGPWMIPDLWQRLRVA
jgi:hypothetical protein